MLCRGYITKAGLACGVAAMALVLGNSAQAQTAGAQQPPAAAQTASPPVAPKLDATARPAQVVDPGQIIVSGSRAIVNGAHAPTPVTVALAEQLRDSSPGSLIDGLNQLPVFSSSTRPGSTGSSGSGAFGNGGNYLELRGLTAARTLVLLDGRRTVATSLALGATDTNLFPQMLIKRVDVVTGGASAAYGSDAVSGVVNFITDTDFTGFKAEAEQGVSTYGDGPSYRIGAAYGAKFGGGRGHIVLSAERYDTTGINDGSTARPWSASGSGLAPIVGGPTTESFIPNVRLNGATYGGTINSCKPAGAACPIANMSFNPNGTLTPFIFGTNVSSTVMSGGSGAAIRTNLTPTVSTNNFYGHVKYDVTDNIQLFAEAIWSDVKSSYTGAPAFPTYGSTALTIYADNAFLPAAVKSAMAANGITSFTMGRANEDLAPNLVQTDTTTYRIVAGASGSIANWKWDVSYERSQAQYKLYSTGNLNLENFYNGADSVINPANGQAICRSTLLGTSQGEGCVPINLFGNGSPSAAAKAYASGTSYADLISAEDDAQFNVRGSPFSTWAGQVSLAFGGEYRHESANQSVDPISAEIKSGAGIQGFPTSLNGSPGGYALSNPQPLNGSFSVKEVFAETDIPLARGNRFAHALDVNGAVRYADYSNVGGAVTWKLGVVYEPVEGLRLRGTRSRDIRAAGISQLFTSAQQTAGLSVRDSTQSGSPLISPVTQIVEGNVALRPEKANTTTAGVVLQPIRALEFSLDYYNIELRDAIAASTLQQVVDGCSAGQASLCGLITRDSTTGVITQVVTPYLNLAAIHTNGLDMETNYHVPLGTGNLAFRAILNHTFHLQTTNAGITVDRAGDVGQRDAVPYWAGTFNMTYTSLEGLTVFAQERYIAAGHFDSTLTAKQLSPALNRIPAVFYTDLTIRQKIGAQYEIFGSINNLLNQSPPLAPGGATNIPRQTNPFFYDQIGRYFTVGARFHF